MMTNGRALYNLLRMSFLEDPSLPVEPWQVEDYRAPPMEELFQRLETIGIPLDENRFQAYADHENSPEELMETLWVGEDFTHFDQAYLLIFELWRRLLPGKPSLSIFCDQLDHLMDLYDEGDPTAEEAINEALIELERILDENADQGEDLHKIFQQISSYCAHDMESFIYDFTAKQIDHDHPMLASELIEGFMSYISDEKWFAFLQFRLLIDTDPDEAEAMLARLLEDLRETPDFELLLEIARFLVSRGDAPHFFETVKLALPLIETEQDFQELIAITSEFHRLLDRDSHAESIAEILKSRKDIPLEKSFSQKDKTLSVYTELLEDFDWSEV